MIYMKKKGVVRIAETWYETMPANYSGCDVIRYKFIDETPENACSVEELFTLLIDLTVPEEKILDGISKNTKYEIKRAKERDNLVVETLIACGEKNDAALDRYILFFNSFAETKGRSDIGYSDISQFYETGNFVVRSVSESGNGNLIAMHSYIFSDGKARLYQSASQFRANSDTEYRKMTGRANRLLHWEDILYFKALNVCYYDMGGWYGGEEDREKLSINQFKEAFGGVKHNEISCIVPITFIGKLSTKIRRLIRGK